MHEAIETYNATKQVSNILKLAEKIGVRIVFRPCPLCHDLGSPKVICEDGVQEGNIRKWPEKWRAIFNSVHVVKCRTCGFVYVWEDIPEILLHTHYQRDFDLERVFLDEAETKAVIYRKVLSLLQRNKRTKGSLLDIGCFEGALLSVAKKKGWDVVGVDVDARAAEFVRKTLGLSVVTGTLKDANFPHDSFDAVTLIDVLEHVKNPLETLIEIQRLLKVGGEVVISVPNFPFQYVKEKWIKGMLGKRGSVADMVHLNHFTARMLAFALTQAGLRPVWFGVPPIHYHPKSSKGLKFRFANLFRKTYYRFSALATTVGICCGASILALAQKPDNREA